MSKTYVFNGIEYKLTGRKATKQLPKRNGNSQPTVDVLYEIQPVSTLFLSESFNRWVRKSDLYEVEEIGTP